MIYLDNTSTTEIDKEVLEEMNKCSEFYGNPGSLHFKGQEAADVIAKSRKIIAKSLNADFDEIIFTGSATEANNLAVLGFMKGKKKLITTSIEHPSVLEPALKLKKEGCEVVFLNVDKEGFIDLDQLKKEIKNADLVSVIHGNHEIGTLQDIKEIGRICRENNVAFHVDASQSFTKTKIDVREINATLITINSHKIHGPKGVAALFVKRGTRLSKIMFGGEQELNLRPGTENVVSIAGFSKAVEISGKDNEKIRKLRDLLIRKLLEIKNTKLNGPEDMEKRLINNVNISFLGKEGESLVVALSRQGICVSTGSACTSRKQGPSHVLKAIRLNDKEIRGALRLSLSRFNTENEINETAEKIKKLVNNG